MSSILDKLLGPDTYDHDEPTSDPWYRPCMVTDFQEQRTAEAELTRCMNRHRRAMKARYHGTTARAHQSSAPVDPMADLEDVLRLPWNRLQERLALGSMAVLFLWVLVGLVVGHPVVMWASALALWAMTALAAQNMARAIRYRKNGYQLHKETKR